MVVVSNISVDHHCVLSNSFCGSHMRHCRLCSVSVVWRTFREFYVSCICTNRCRHERTVAQNVFVNRVLEPSFYELVTSLRLFVSKADVTGRTLTVDDPISCMGT